VSCTKGNLLTLFVNIRPTSKALPGTNALAYFAGVSVTTELFYDIYTYAQCYIKFCVCNLRMFVVSESVCPWQAFPDKSNVCE
jgi:hypothetical protein